MLNRRAFVRRSAAGAAVLLLPQATARAAALREGRFRQGVLSGDPTPDGVTLLTLGLFLFVINALMFWAAASMLDGFNVAGFGAALIGSLIYSVCGMVIDVVMERLS